MTITDKEVQLWQDKKLKVNCCECKKEIVDRLRTISDWGPMCQSCWEREMNRLQNRFPDATFYVLPK